jgi:hypothetical protein
VAFGYDADSDVYNTGEVGGMGDLKTLSYFEKCSTFSDVYMVIQCLIKPELV